MPNIEEQLKKAIAEGKFDNLPGKGKPLNLGESNPYADPDWELAYRMLKDAGYSLPWIETRNQIEMELESARQDLERAWEYFRAQASIAHDKTLAVAEWEHARSAFKEKLQGLNKRIRDYNLEVPNARFQRPVLSLEAELNRNSTNQQL